MSSEVVAAGADAGRERGGTWVSCNLCGGDDFTVLFPAGAAQANQIVRCRRCDLIYANPRTYRLEPEIMADIDPGASWWPEAFGQRREKERLQVRDTDDARAVLAAEFPARGRLLEIGSGFGYTLAECKKQGWDVLGIEPFLGFVRHGREQLGVDALHGTLEDLDLPDASFDAAIMLHVIEHVPDPRAALERVCRALKPGGMLVVETPTYDGLMFKILGRRERSISCDTHTYFFTMTTLRRLAVLAGFDVVRMDYVGRSLTYDRLLWNFGVMSKSERVKDALGRASRALGLADRWVYLNTRDMQRMYLRKLH